MYKRSNILISTLYKHFNEELKDLINNSEYFVKDWERLTSIAYGNLGLTDNEKIQQYETIIPDLVNFGNQLLKIMKYNNEIINSYENEVDDRKNKEAELIKENEQLKSKIICLNKEAKEIKELQDKIKNLQELNNNLQCKIISMQELENAVQLINNNSKVLCNTSRLKKGDTIAKYDNIKDEDIWQLFNSGMTYYKIAKHYGVPSNTIRYRLEKIKERLAEASNKQEEN